MNKFPKRFFQDNNIVYKQLVTSTGAVTKPEGFSDDATIIFYVLGAGGGGGRGYWDGSAASTLGGGGGAGFLFSVPYRLVTSMSATIGTGGIGRVATEGLGTAGGDTTLVLTCSGTNTGYGTDLIITVVAEGGDPGTGRRTISNYTILGGDAVTVAFSQAGGPTVTPVSITDAETVGGGTRVVSSAIEYDTSIYGGVSGAGTAIPSWPGAGTQIEYAIISPMIANLCEDEDSGKGGFSIITSDVGETTNAGNGGYGCGGGGGFVASGATITGGDGGSGLVGIMIVPTPVRLRHHYPFGFIY